MSKPLTINEARRILGDRVTIRVADREYRVAPSVYELRRIFGLSFADAVTRQEELACYESDLEAAVGTGEQTSMWLTIEEEKIRRTVARAGVDAIAPHGWTHAG